MIKVGIILDEIGDDFEQSLDIALEHGVRHVELRSLWGTNISEATADQIARAKDAIERRNMRVIGIAGPVFKIHLSEELAGGVGDTHRARASGTVEEHLELLEGTIRTAKTFGTDIVRTFAFWRKGAPTPEIYDRIEEHLRKAVAKAEAAGVRLALENEHACFIGTASESVEILKRIPSKHLGLIWDPGNAANLDPVEDVFPKGYEALKAGIGFERIFHVHLKDVTTAGDKVRFTEFGKGEIDFRGQLRALVEDGYQGAISMETHWRAEGMSKARASGICLDNLWKIIEEEGLRDHFE